MINIPNYSSQKEGEFRQTPSTLLGKSVTVCILFIDKITFISDIDYRRCDIVYIIETIYLIYNKLKLTFVQPITSNNKSTTSGYIGLTPYLSLTGRSIINLPSNIVLGDPKSEF